jgi:NAD(P)H-flavin reductase
MMAFPAARPGDPMLPQPWLVRQVLKETHDTFTLTLEPPDGSVAGFRPGQFSMLWVFGVGELPISISGNPSDAGRLVYTVRSVGRATDALVRRNPGDAVGVRGPFGTAWPLEDARDKDVLIVAGGIGLAPLRGVIYHVLHHRQDYGRLTLLYGARSPHDLLYRHELAAWAKQHDTEVRATVDFGAPSWRGNVGVVTTLFKHVPLQPGRTIAMVCGPEIMMRFVARDLEARGILPSDVYLSMERNMKCAVGLCGHCQWGPHFICKDGPIFPYSRIRNLLGRHEL